MRFDRKKFFDECRRQFGSLKQQQVNGLNRLLAAIEDDPHINRLEWAAYMLATVKHETANTFQPIHEYGPHSYFVQRYGSQTAVGRRLGNDTPEEGFDYAGKGDVQLTGESNYEKAEAALRREYPYIVTDFEHRTGKVFDLTVGDQPNDKSDPQNMLDPAISYAVMSYGMRTGMFTGKKLADYIRDGHVDYVHARRIINGLDRADVIAAHAKGFERALKAAAAVSTEQAFAKPVDGGASSGIEPTADTAVPREQPPADLHRPLGLGDPPPAPATQPVEVQKESPSWMVKLGAPFTALAGLGINLGSLIQTKLEAMTPQQIAYLIVALGLVVLAVWWWTRSAKGAQVRTMQLVDHAANPNANTVTLTK